MPDEKAYRSVVIAEAIHKAMPELTIREAEIIASRMPSKVNLQIGRLHFTNGSKIQIRLLVSEFLSRGETKICMVHRPSVSFTEAE